MVDYGYADYSKRKDAGALNIEVDQEKPDSFNLVIDKFDQNTGEKVASESRSIDISYVNTIRSAINNTIAELKNELEQLDILEADIESVKQQN